MICLGKAFVRRLEVTLHFLRIPYDIAFRLSDFVLRDVEWWLEVLPQPHLCCISFELLLKHPKDSDFKLWTDATTTIGGDGYATDDQDNVLFYFQFNWKDTNINNTLVRKLDIDVRELLLSIVGIVLLLPWLHNKSVNAII